MQPGSAAGLDAAEPDCLSEPHRPQPNINVWFHMNTNKYSLIYDDHKRSPEEKTEAARRHIHMVINTRWKKLVYPGMLREKDTKMTPEQKKNTDRQLKILNSIQCACAVGRKASWETESGTELVFIWEE